jgi:hypothetical protein
MPVQVSHQRFGLAIQVSAFPFPAIFASRLANRPCTSSDFRPLCDSLNLADDVIEFRSVASDAF